MKCNEIFISPSFPEVSNETLAKVLSSKKVLRLVRLRMVR